MRPSRLLPTLALPLLLCFAGVLSAHAAEQPEPPTVDLSAEASHTATNDLAVATAYFEATARAPAAVAKEVNQAMAAALATARSYEAVKTRSGGTQTWPVYGRDNRDLQGWRMRSEVRLESRDLGALSELLGKLQGKLAVSQVSLEPAPETRRDAAAAATVEAIRNFRARAAMIADTLGKGYRIRHLNVSESAQRMPMYARMKTTAMAEDAAPLPLEGGESEVGVTVNGTIELTD